MLTDEQLRGLLEATDGTTTGKREVVVTKMSVSLYATDENCRIYRTELDPVCLKQTHYRQIKDAQFHAAFDPSTCAELVREVIRLREFEREHQALDKLTDRHLKFDLPETLKS